jgi:hypothetical protein
LLDGNRLLGDTQNMSISRRHFFSELLNTVADQAAKTLRESEFPQESTAHTPLDSLKINENTPTDKESSPGTVAREAIPEPDLPVFRGRGLNDDDFPEHLKPKA